MKNILLTFLLTILLFSCKNSSSPLPEKEVAKEVGKPEKNDSVQDQNTDQNTFGGLEPSNRSPTELDSNAPRYWYVFFSAHRKNPDSDWKGYEVIRIDESYFDVNKAIHIIYPSVVNEDYIGIEFFKEVSEKTYIEYKSNEK